MQRIPNIKLTEAEVQYILTKRKFDYGSEATICFGSNHNTLYKIFTAGQKNPIPICMSDNKEQKIMLLYQMQPQNSVLPLQMISMDGILIGYEMTTDPMSQTLLDLDLTRDEMIEALLKSQAVLEYYAQNGIVYGDVKNDNILFNRATGQVQFCDMDNIQIGEYPIDLTSYELEYYQLFHKKIDAHADAYMHNLLTLESLHYRNIDMMQDIIYRLQDKDYPVGFSDEAFAILDGMASTERFNGEYIIQYVKKKK